VETPKERLKESIIEMQKMREGKLPKKTWEQFRDKLKGKTEGK
jgi:hypothetical protein